MYCVEKESLSKLKKAYVSNSALLAGKERISARQAIENLIEERPRYRSLAKSLVIALGG